MSLEPLLVSTAIVAVAEMGDKTQLLSFVLAAKLKRPVPIVLGILVATLANHFLAGWIGAWLATLVSPGVLRWTIAASFVVFGLWTLKPDELGEDRRLPDTGAFLTTLGMMIANVPAVWMGEILSHRVNMKWMRWIAASLFVLLGALTLFAGDDVVRMRSSPGPSPPGGHP